MPGAVQIPIAIGHGPIHAHFVQAGINANFHPLSHTGVGGVNGVGVGPSLLSGIVVLQLLAAIHVAILPFILGVAILLLLQCIPRNADGADILVITLI